MQNHKKAAVVTPFWATVISTIMCAMTLGGMGYAWNANADFEVLKRDVKEIKEADLQPQLSTLKIAVARIEEQSKTAADTSSRLERQQSKMDDKLDKLLERRSGQ